jgi:uncharacterized RDD family membrane protein YckC
MQTIEHAEAPPLMEKPRIYATFWGRWLALIIDYLIVSAVMLPLVILVNWRAPNSIELQMPFDVFTQEHVLSTESAPEKNADGSTTIVDTRLVEKTVLWRWTYLYSERVKHFAGKSETERHLLDPVTKTELQIPQSSNWVLFVLLIYWSLMESSRLQASLGKRAMRIQVMDKEGNRLTFGRALGRNVAKFFSVLTCFIGFAMPLWTKNRQALHDLIARCYLDQS